jgi:hypothetical protein
MKSFLFFTTFANNNIKTRLIHITEKRETIIQIARINPNHLIKLIPKINKITATINHVTLLSQIADQDFLNHIFVASIKFFQFFISSFTLSNIKILASIAIPILSIKPAIDASVRVIQIDFTIISTITIYKNSDKEAIKPDSL